MMVHNKVLSLSLGVLALFCTLTIGRPVFSPQAQGGYLICCDESAHDGAGKIFTDSESTFSRGNSVGVSIQADVHITRRSSDDDILSAMEKELEGVDPIEYYRTKLKERGHLYAVAVSLVRQRQIQRQRGKMVEANDELYEASVPIFEEHTRAVRFLQALQKEATKIGDKGLITDASLLLSDYHMITG